MGPWDGWHMGTWGWGGMFIGGLMMLLFWGAVIALAFFAIRAITQSGQTGRQDGRPEGPSEGRSPERGSTALEILQERYARGELTRDEYLDMRRDLEA